MLLYSKILSITQLSAYMKGHFQIMYSSKILNFKIDMRHNTKQVKNTNVRRKIKKYVKEEERVLDIELAVKRRN